jgi:hypothetical protein
VESKAMVYGNDGKLKELVSSDFQFSKMNTYIVIDWS